MIFFTCVIKSTWVHYIFSIYSGNFSKALDTVNHDLLFKKLELYGIMGIALHWFLSYSYGRVQGADYNNV